MIKVSKNVYRNVIDMPNPNNAIPRTIGLMKGDLVVFNAAGSPVRFPAGNTPGKVPTTDPTSPTGWSLQEPGSGGGGSGGTQTVTLVNNSGAAILTGIIVVIDVTAGEREIKKATTEDTGTLFITSENSAGTGDSVECYCIPNTICNVLCTSDAVAVGDKLCLSDTDGYAQSGSYPTIGIALTAKVAGSVGYVKVLISGTFSYSCGTTDLVDGVSPLPPGHLYFYYEEPEEENNG